MFGGGAGRGCGGVQIYAILEQYLNHGRTLVLMTEEGHKQEGQILFIIYMSTGEELKVAQTMSCVEYSSCEYHYTYLGNELEITYQSFMSQLHTPPSIDRNQSHN